MGIGRGARKRPSPLASVSDTPHNGTLENKNPSPSVFVYSSMLRRYASADRRPRPPALATEGPRRNRSANKNPSPSAMVKEAPGMSLGYIGSNGLSSLA